MPSIKREDDIESIYVKHSERNGRWVPKWTSPGTPGVPDRIVLTGSAPLADFLYDRCGYSKSDAETEAIALLAKCVRFTELKTPRGKLRPRQKRVIARLRKMGFSVEVVRE